MGPICGIDHTPYYGRCYDFHISPLGGVTHMPDYGTRVITYTLLLSSYKTFLWCRSTRPTIAQWLLFCYKPFMRHRSRCPIVELLLLCWYKSLYVVLLRHTTLAYIACPFELSSETLDRTILLAYNIWKDYRPMFQFNFIHWFIIYFQYEEITYLPTFMNLLCD